MGRNAQLIRQWAILKQIESTRWSTIPDMANRHYVSTKTIRRDLAALMEAGFPLYDDRYEGKVYWRLAEDYKGLPLANLTLSELAALYFSRNMVSARLFLRTSIRRSRRSKAHYRKRTSHFWTPWIR